MKSKLGKTNRRLAVIRSGRSGKLLLAFASIAILGSGSWQYFTLSRLRQFHAPAALTPREEPPVPTGDPVGPTDGLDDVKRNVSPLPGHQLRPFGYPACSRSLYRLRFPGVYALVQQTPKWCTIRLRGGGYLQ
jgi:hypothetical protein